MYLLIAYYVLGTDAVSSIKSMKNAGQNLRMLIDTVEMPLDAIRSLLTFIAPVYIQLLMLSELCIFLGPKFTFFILFVS